MSNTSVDPEESFRCAEQIDVDWESIPIVLVQLYTTLYLFLCALQ